MSFLWFATTENERKQNEYDKLHNEIRDALSDHEKYINKAKEALSSYKSKAPNLSNSKIPSNYFELHRERLTEELVKHISYEEEKKLNYYPPKIVLINFIYIINIKFTLII